MLGSGKEKPRLQQEAAERSLGNITFLPPLPKLEMGQALAAADACLAILKPVEMYKTTYPNKVFDYMAAGRPVILAIDGVIRQVVTEVDAGIFVPPGNPRTLADAIQYLAAHPEQCRQLGLNGRNLVKSRFSRVELADKFTALLESLRRRNG